MPRPFQKPTLPPCQQLVAAQATKARVGQGITPKIVTLPLGHVPVVYTHYSPAPVTIMSKARQRVAFNGVLKLKLPSSLRK